MSNFLDKDGLQRFFTGLKNVFAPKSHKHSASDISSSDTADQGKFLRADGTWQTVSGGGTAYEHPTYTAFTGKPTSNLWPELGGTFVISQVQTNELGHVIRMTDRTISLPHVADELWINSSPTSSFPAQTIAPANASFSYYDAFLIVSREFNTSERHTAEIIWKWTAQNQHLTPGAIHCWASTNSNRNGMRNVTIRSNDDELAITFSACEYNGNTNNSYCIPLEIYGLKFGGM